jgi:hypothetical protein
MSIFHYRDKMRMAAGRPSPYAFGGGSDSNSTSSSTSNTENIDQRLLQESGAIGANSSGGGSSSVNLSSATSNAWTQTNTDNSINTVITQTLDGGAINAAFGLGNHAIDSVTDFASGALSGAHHTAELALTGALSSVADTKEAFYNAAKIAQSSAQGAQQSATAAYANATEQVATAYDGARVGTKNIMIVSGIALAAMAVAVIGSKK